MTEGGKEQHLVSFSSTSAASTVPELLISENLSLVGFQKIKHCCHLCTFACISVVCSSGCLSALHYTSLLHHFHYLKM